MIVAPFLFRQKRIVSLRRGTLSDVIMVVGNRGDAVDYNIRNGLQSEHRYRSRTRRPSHRLLLQVGRTSTLSIVANVFAPVEVIKRRYAAPQHLNSKSVLAFCTINTLIKSTQLIHSDPKNTQSLKHSCLLFNLDMRK